MGRWLGWLGVRRGPEPELLGPVVAVEDVGRIRLALAGDFDLEVVIAPDGAVSVVVVGGEGDGLEVPLPGISPSTAVRGCVALAEGEHGAEPLRVLAAAVRAALEVPEMAGQWDDSEAQQLLADGEGWL